MAGGALPRAARRVFPPLFSRRPDAGHAARQTPAVRRCCCRRPRHAQDLVSRRQRLSSADDHGGRVQRHRQTQVADFFRVACQRRTGDPAGAVAADLEPVPGYAVRRGDRPEHGRRRSAAGPGVPAANGHAGRFHFGVRGHLRKDHRQSGILQGAPVAAPSGRRCVFRSRRARSAVAADALRPCAPTWVTTGCSRPSSPNTAADSC